MHGSLLLIAALIAAQPMAAAGAPAIEGTVLDARERPLAHVEVVLAQGQEQDGSVPVLSRAQANEQGHFRLALPDADALRRMGSERVGFFGTVCAFPAGKTMTEAAYSRLRVRAKPIRLLVSEPSKRFVLVECAAGGPLASVRVAPYIVNHAGSIGWSPIPDEVSQRMAVETGPNGRAAMHALADDDSLFAVRIAGPGIASQIWAFSKATESAQETVTIALQPTGGLTGSIVMEDGSAPPRPIELEVWSETLAFQVIGPVKFDGPRVCTARDGSFQTPAALLRGARFRVIARPQGFAPLASPWVKLEEESVRIPTLVLRKLNGISGRVVDRQNRPVTGAEVFQAGDGPEPTSATTNTQGRFQLGGYSFDKAFVFAEKTGFRFSGRAVDCVQSAHEVDIVLTRVDETSERSMATLPDALQREEMRALAVGILKPLVDRAIERGPENDRYQALPALAEIDPTGAIELVGRTCMNAPVFR